MIVSYILPLYKKASLFRMMLPHSACYRSPSAEVVCVVDDPGDEGEVLEIVKACPEVKFRVVVNDWEHAWRPPCIAYNVGVRNTLADHVVFCDPESAIVLPHPTYLERLIVRDYRMCYAGITWNVHDFGEKDASDVIELKLQVSEATSGPWWFTYGLLLVPKIAVERIRGFDESRATYGFDDTDIRIRLCRLGYRCTVDGRIKVFHAAHKNDVDRTAQQVGPGPDIALHAQEQSWGRCYSRIAWDWNKP
jgi:hypothetical protein